jgi:NAD(P) transhydrogenase beta subunit
MADETIGMPIVGADKARMIIAIKRSKNPRFAGIENELYFTDHTWMLFEDAKEVVGEPLDTSSTSRSHENCNHNDVFREPSLGRTRGAHMG